MLGAIAAALLTASALLPLTAIILPMPWLPFAIPMIMVIALVGLVTRAVTRLGVLAPVAQLIAWSIAATAAYSALANDGQHPAPSALWGVIPTPQLIARLPDTVAAAADQIVYGVAPLTANGPLAFVLVAVAGLVAILVDGAAVTARLPIAAIVVAAAIAVIPPVAVTSSASIIAIVWLLASAILLLYATGRRMLPARASAVGAAALVVALAVTPLLPQPVARFETGGGSTSVNASLDLGDDLRHGVRREVLRFATDADAAPYLRLATLTEFDGEEWTRDTGGLLPLARGLETEAYVTSSETARIDGWLEVTALSSSFLPVPASVTAVEGTSGDWQLQPLTGTVHGAPRASEGELVRVTAEMLIPSSERLETAEARPGPLGEDIDPEEGTEMMRAATTLPEGDLATIAATAAEVTSGAANDFDALDALQSWFRGGDFTYSLDAPVAEDFDGSGLDAINDFLDVRAGYCVHFAATFAVMARTLDMPSRVVLGYLPGTRTTSERDGMPVYSVLSDQLHAWPEVFFDDIGWIPFEPTTGLGAETMPDTPQADDENTPSPTPSDDETPDDQTESPDETASPEPTGPDGADGSAPNDEDDTGGASPWAAILVVVAIVALLLAPAAIRLGLHLTRVAAAARGDATAAWRELLATSADAGVPLRAHESPRAFAARLSSDHGAPDDALAPLVHAIERASYAPATSAASAASLVPALHAVRRSLLTTPGRKTLAVVAPRSLLVAVRRRASTNADHTG